jgi:hypothetical protein
MWVLDAGYPWGLLVANNTYLLREHLGAVWQPRTFETAQEAWAEAKRLYREAPCYPRMLVTREM